MRIGIIGAGIGGITLAAFLKKSEHQVTIFEKSESYRIDGAGIILATNATQIFSKLNIEQSLVDQGNVLDSMNITDQKLQLLMQSDLKRFEKEFGVKNIAIHRKKLHEIIVAKYQLKDNTIFKKSVQKIHSDNKIATAFFEDGTHESFDIIIGADGIGSKTRSYVTENAQIRDSKQHCWRGIATFELSEHYSKSLFEAWGKGKRFGFVKISENSVYWYALTNDVKNFHNINLETEFRNFHPLIGDILFHTDPQSIIEASIGDLNPLNTWHKNNVCLIGDAAHATTPNLGQGACQAIESAYFLSEALQENATITLAFDQYQKKRIDKAHMVTKLSWRIGKMAHIENTVLIKLRNSLMKLNSKESAYKQNKKLYKI